MRLRLFINGSYSPSSLDDMYCGTVYKNEYIHGVLNHAEMVFLNTIHENAFRVYQKVLRDI